VVVAAVIAFKPPSLSRCHRAVAANTTVKPATAVKPPLPLSRFVSDACPWGDGSR
jgi:hypothetical protein